MRLSRNVLAAGAAIGLLAAAGTAVAQEGMAQEHATRTIRVPENAVVLVLPPGARVLAPGAQEAAVPMPFGMMPFGAGPFGAGPSDAGPASRIDAMFQRMNTEMDAMMQAAEHQLPMQPMMGPGHTIQAMMRDMPQGASSVVVTSFSDGRHSCTQRMVYSGNGQAPVIHISGDACGAVAPNRMVPAAVPERVAPRGHGPRLIEAAAHRARPVELASLAR